MAKDKVYVNRKLKAVDYRKFCIPVFNRATYARVASLITRLEEIEHCDVVVVLSSGVAMEKYGNASTYIKKYHKNVEILPFDEDNELGTEEGVSRMGGDIVSAFGSYLSRNKFDAVIVVADRFETIFAASAAVMCNTPLVHLQGGEITNNMDERIRHAVTKLSDYHFCCTALAQKYIKKMGEDHRRIWNFGCPSLDLLRECKISRPQNKIEDYVVACFHPETENQEHALEQTEIVLKAVLDYVRKRGMKVHWFWPNPDPGREDIVMMLNQALEEFPNYLVKAENRDPASFGLFLARSAFVVGNSSMGIRECSFLGVPVVNVGLRQGYRERAGNVIDVDFEQHDILGAMAKQHRIAKYVKSTLYGTGYAAYHIVEKLMTIDFEQKGALPYPFTPEFEKYHFGSQRFDNHKRTYRGEYNSETYATSETKRRGFGVKLEVSERSAQNS